MYSACPIIRDVGMNTGMSRLEYGVAVVRGSPQRPDARSLADHAPCVPPQALNIAIGGLLDADRRARCRDCPFH
jgi:hypothetical protein